MIRVEQKCSYAQAVKISATAKVAQPVLAEKPLPAEKIVNVASVIGKQAKEDVPTLSAKKTRLRKKSKSKKAAVVVIPPVILPKKQPAAAVQTVPVASPIISYENLERILAESIKSLIEALIHGGASGLPDLNSLTTICDELVRKVFNKEKERETQNQHG